MKTYYFTTIKGYRYEHFLESYGIHSRYYECVPENNWEIDIKQMESLIDENTAAIIIANPSNPCGSVFSKYHLEEILEVAEKNFLPIISDEVYEHMVFPGIKYHAISSLKSAQNVNILCCSAISKRFLVPGESLFHFCFFHYLFSSKSVSVAPFLK